MMIVDIARTLGSTGAEVALATVSGTVLATAYRATLDKPGVSGQRVALQPALLQASTLKRRTRWPKR